MLRYTLPLFFLLLCTTFAIGQTTPAVDTLATATPDNSTRERYAADLDELARMKEKFRQQQERKARERDRGGNLRDTWNDTTVEEQAPTAPLTVNPRDTVQLRSSVRSGLYPPAQPDLDETKGWERNVRSDLPREEPVDAAETARLDAEYARQLAELEELRAELRQARGEPTSAPAPDLAAKSPVVVEKATPAAAPLAISFIPNTAYPNTAGYDALDALVRTVQAATGMVEIRVHTARKLDQRAAQLLSEERATTIRNHLIKAGISSENFRVIGYGNHESAAGERVELIVR
ncbi:hypothetical protein LEM8419_02182 [Neolewinella maritima]|uniref:OmpA-like domain-containing protein n=1 Tax=Neolewinella maritima TaxID=1383882 RepID=A0ABM9B1R0_9BACT|nr:OmpA family protein [Neolewinella maritima]CAH1001281.1 hypothetical protein LEM8419_02182 [Neolewinella maritima]